MATSSIIHSDARGHSSQLLEKKTDSERLFVLRLLQMRPNHVGCMWLGEKITTNNRADPPSEKIPLIAST